MIARSVALLSLLILVAMLSSQARAKNIKHLPSQEKVYSACYNQAAFLMYAASAGSLYIDPSIPPAEVLAKTGRYTTDTSAYDEMAGNASKFGASLLLSKKEINNYIIHFQENQDDANLYVSPDISDTVLKDCMVNPRRFIPSYDRLEKAGKLR